MIIHQLSNSGGSHNFNAFIYSGREYSTHFHANSELIYAIEGATEVCVNGTSDVLEAGEFLLISPYATHSFHTPKNATSWVGVFSKDFVPDFAGKHAFSSFSKFRCDEEIEAFLKAHLFHEAVPEHYLLTACLYLVCGQCIRHAAEYVQTGTADFAREVIGYITENLSGNITMKDAANQLNYEYHYFSSLFNKCFSMNYRRFINVLRFDQACELLSKKEQNITEVCAACGFESVRSFNRVFKEFSGMTPREYRSRLLPRR